jgi:hypothetical protein
MATNSATPAGADRAARAEAAPPPSESTNDEMKRETKNMQEEGTANAHLRVPTELDAMQDGAAYVRVVASRVDLVGASVRLVCATDEKIAKAELDRLREMKFGKVGAVAPEEQPRIDFSDWPGRIQERD